MMINYYNFFQKLDYLLGTSCMQTCVWYNLYCEMKQSRKAMCTHREYFFVKTKSHIEPLL